MSIKLVLSSNLEIYLHVFAVEQTCLGDIRCTEASPKSSCADDKPSAAADISLASLALTPPCGVT